MEDISGGGEQFDDYYSGGEDGAAAPAAASPLQSVASTDFDIPGSHPIGDVPF